MYNQTKTVLEDQGVLRPKFKVDVDRSIYVYPLSLEALSIIVLIGQGTQGGIHKNSLCFAFSIDTTNNCGHATSTSSWRVARRMLLLWQRISM